MWTLILVTIEAPAVGWSDSNGFPMGPCSGPLLDSGGVISASIADWEESRVALVAGVLTRSWFNMKGCI